MKKLILLAILSFAACKSNPSTPNTPQSGYQGIWHERDTLNVNPFTLDFTGPAVCSITQGGSSWSPAVQVSTVDSSWYLEGEIPARIIGKTLITLAWGSGFNAEGIWIYLSNDSLLGFPATTTFNPVNNFPSIIFTQ